jgi:hypothetical protein
MPTVESAAVYLTALRTTFSDRAGDQIGLGAHDQRFVLGDVQRARTRLCLERRIAGDVGDQLVECDIFDFRLSRRFHPGQLDSLGNHFLEALGFALDAVELVHGLRAGETSRRRIGFVPAGDRLQHRAGGLDQASLRLARASSSAMRRRESGERISCDTSRIRRR